jgi:hypothetical protein
VGDAGDDDAADTGDDDAGDDADARDDAADTADAGITVVAGDGVELCRVAARRIDPEDTGLKATGPDAEAVLELVRTYA